MAHKIRWHRQSSAGQHRETVKHIVQLRLVTNVISEISLMLSQLPPWFLCISHGITIVDSTEEIHEHVGVIDAHTDWTTKLALHLHLRLPHHTEVVLTLIPGMLGASNILRRHMARLDAQLSYHGGGWLCVRVAEQA